MRRNKDFSITQPPRQENPEGSELYILSKALNRKNFLWIAFLFALLFPASAAIPRTAMSLGEVRLGKKTILLIRKNIGSISPKDRATIVNSRIMRILTDPKLDPSQIQVGKLDKSDTVVKLGKMAIIDVTASDAAAENLSVRQLANDWAGRLRDDLLKAKPFYAAKSKLNINTLGEHHTLLFVLELILLLVMARICGEIMARLKQPPVVGQVIAGIILGRSIFGSLLPSLHALIFPVSATQSYLLQIISWLGSIFLLLIIGLETDIQMIRRQGGIAVWTAIGGIVIPFLLGFLVGVFLPPAFMLDIKERWILALFLAILFSVSSVPVVAKLLMEMNLFRRNIGQIILSTAMAQDTMGWIMLAVLSGFASGSVFNGFTLAKIIVGTILYMLFILTVGQRLVSSILRWVNNHISGDYPLLTAVILLMFLSAGITQLIGIHAILGSFMIGVILSASPLIKKSVIHPIEAITMSLLAPIFFAAAGLNVDMGVIMHPRILIITLIIILMASIGKIVGCYAGGRKGGLGVWESLTIGFGATAYGAMGPIFGMLGLSMGILNVDMFSIIIVMSVVTTAFTPFLLGRSIKHVKFSEEEIIRLEKEDAAAQSALYMVKRILMPTSGGPHTRMAVQLLQGLAHDHPIEVTAFHTVKDGGISEINIFPPELEILRKTSNEVILRKTVKEDVVEGILQEASLGYDMVVLGCGADSSSENAVFGSIADSIAHVLPTPLMVVRAPASEGEWRLRRVLVPTNGVRHSEQAVELGVALAHAANAEVTVLCVAEASEENGFPQSLNENQSEKLAQQIVEHAASMGGIFGVHVETVVQTDSNAGRNIVQLAHDTDTDLILLTGVPRPTKQLFLGKTIAYILRNARCAVAVIKPETRLGR